MIKLSIRNNFPEVARRLEKLPEEIANKAMARALNKTVEQGRAEMARAISAEYRVRVGDVKRRLSITRASVKGQLRLSASLLATRGNGLFGSDESRGMNLIAFVVGGQPKRTAKGKMRQLNFQIKRGGGRKQIPGAFIATNKRTGGTAVFVREGKDRMPIATKTTIDVRQMFNTKRINGAIRNAMLQRFAANFDREVGAILKGFIR